jgi:hypothetical protein
MRRFAIALLAACGGNGSTADGPMEPDSYDTPPFVPILCTSGTPGEPNCPLNTVPLDEVGTAGATFRFTWTLLGSGHYIGEAKLTAGPEGLYVENPIFMLLPGDSTVPTATGAFAGVTLNIPPNETQIVGTGTAAIVQLDTTGRVFVRFDEIGPYRP